MSKRCFDQSENSVEMEIGCDRCNGIQEEVNRGKNSHRRVKFTSDGRRFRLPTLAYFFGDEISLALCLPYFGRRTLATL